MPLRVTITRYFSSSNSGTRIIDVTFSSAVMGSRLAIFIPLEVLEPSGIS